MLRTTIDKWLNAGVLEEGRLSHPDTGTPQGGVISPILMNIYLHEVLDKCYEEVVRPRLSEEGCLIRYADDAEKVLSVLPKRFGRFTLTLHPGKTKLVRFTRPGPGGNRNVRFHPESFDFPGFTHH